MKNIFALLLVFVFYFDLNAQNIVNGDFDQGASSGWTKYSQGGYGLIGTAQYFYSAEITPQVLPRSGLYMARLGGFSYEINSISQFVTLPNTPKVYMGIYYQTRASTTSECAGLWVGAQVRVYAAGQVISDQYLCNYNAINEWKFGYFDLTAAAGQNIEIGFRADAASSVWSFVYFDDVTIFTSLTGIKDDTFSPKAFKLDQNFPNPFNPATTIKFELANACHVNLKIYSILGEVVADLMNSEKFAGFHEIDFDASKLSSGIYFYELTAGTFRSMKKMIVLK
jgi:hypothetical protein